MHSIPLPRTERWRTLFASLIVVLSLVALDSARAEPIAGLLKVSTVNPRYFSVGSGAQEKAIYLTGANLWNNLQDGVGFGACDRPGAAFDWNAYLDLLASHHLNFIRLWRWEHFKFTLPQDLDPSRTSYCVTQHPWMRSGPDAAYDGGPKFDLSRFDQSYFDRVRTRVMAAGKRDIYVSVMFFEGFCLHVCDAATQIAGHPFDGQNNINGIDIDALAQHQSLPVLPRVLELQHAYIRKLIDTVQDLDNVLYEVVNESNESIQWQRSVIDYIKRYESERGYKKHPVGVSSEYPSGKNRDLFTGAADWVMPGTWPPRDGDYANDPPASDGTKVVVSDNDHYFPCQTTPVWAWKSLLRGLNASTLDCGIGDPTKPSAELKPVRTALGDIRKQANRMDLLAMTPRADLASSGYALAHPGAEYLVLAPADSASSKNERDTPTPPRAVAVTLVPGSYSVEWFDITTGVWQEAQSLSVSDAGPKNFTPPFAARSPAVLYLKRRSL